MRKPHYGTNDPNIADLLLGRRIIGVRQDITDDSSTEWEMVLDNGRTLEIHPNEGCGGCSEGWYSVMEIAKVDNIITNVRFENDDDERYSIYVVAEGIPDETEVLRVVGHDNGWYGTGYTITVRSKLSAF